MTASRNRNISATGAKIQVKDIFICVFINIAIRFTITICIDGFNGFRTIRILKHNGIIITIRKHIVAQEALARGGVAVGADKSAEGRIVIAGLQIVEPGFFDEGLSLSEIWGGFMLVKKLIKLRSGRTIILLPGAILSARAERMQRHDRGGGKIPNLFPLWTPLIQTAKRVCPFGYPRANGKCGKKLTGGEATEKANCRTGNLPTRTVILSKAKNP